MKNPIVEVTSSGLYCAAGDFYIDPWQPVDTAIITHAHGDHAHWGCKRYFTSNFGKKILAHRIRGIDIEQKTEDVDLPVVIGVDEGQSVKFKDVIVSFHPAGHILGSAQIRLELNGKIWVVSGDYKRDHDPTCRPFEVVPCDVFITEATFALPIYQWQPTSLVAKEILQWWDECARDQRAAVLFCYALGKSQRILAELAELCDRPVYLHGAHAPLTQIYRDAGIKMLSTELVSQKPRDYKFTGDLIMAPPSASRGTWVRRFGDASFGFASGWMQIRGMRRRRGYDRGFVVSDHADWNGLIQSCKQSQAQLILPTHGATANLTRYLNEIGLAAIPLKTAYGREDDADMHA